MCRGRGEGSPFRDRVQLYMFHLQSGDSREALHVKQQPVQSRPPVMVRPRKEKKAKDIKLRQPDRSGPTEKTLLQIAEDQNLFNLAAKQQRNKGPAHDGDDADDEGCLSSSADRVMDTLLYAVCLAMLHFTLDFLVQHQYAMEIEYSKIVVRAFQALMGSSLPEFLKST